MNLPPYRTAASRRGFTLLELLVVCGILAVVVGAVVACIASGIRVWDRAQTISVLETRSLIGLELLERDLRNAFVFYDIGFRGDSYTVSFPGSIWSDDSASTTASEGADTRVLAKISYSYNRADATLARSASAYPGDGDSLTRTETVIRSLDDMRFEFFEGGERTELWDSATNMPDRIDISLSMASGTDRLDIERTVLLPVTNSFVL